MSSTLRVRNFVIGWSRPFCGTPSGRSYPHTGIMVENSRMAARFRIYLIQASFWARLWQLLKAAGNGLSNNNSFGVAKAAAYSALLSFFPVLTTLAAILVQARADQVSHAIASVRS